MSNQESENYLDQLLNQMNNPTPKEEPFVEELDLFAQEAAANKKLLNEVSSKMGIITKDVERDFLDEFEKELNIKDEEDELDDFGNIDQAFNDEYEREINETLGKTQPEIGAFGEDPYGEGLPSEELSVVKLSEENVSVDDLLAEEPVVEEKVEEELTVEELTVEELAVDTMPVEDSPQEEVSEDSILAGVDSILAGEVGNIMEESSTEEPATEEPVSEALDMDAGVDEASGEQNLSMEDIGSMEELPVMENGEVDLTGMGDEDLMDLLGGSDELSEIGAILNADGSMESVDGVDSIEDFAEQEMKAQQEAVTEEEKGKKKKKGFFARLKDALFGPDEEDAVDISPTKGVDAAVLSGENAEILAQLEQEGGAAPAPAGKEKKKKEKKEKKKKEPKPKKEKPKKEPKPKKEKKPKEVDKTPPLPKGPVIMIFLMAISLGALIYLGGTLLSYSSDIENAKTAYSVGNYVGAYDYLAGASIKEEDQELYEKIVILSGVQSKQQLYKVYVAEEQHLEALDALICAIGRCDNYIDRAEECNCYKELQKLRSDLENELQNNYSMTVEDAMRIYNQRSRKEYTLALQKKIKELGLNKE